jgi:Zn-dependent metalloprotease
MKQRSHRRWLWFVGLASASLVGCTKPLLNNCEPASEALTLATLHGESLIAPRLSWDPLRNAPRKVVGAFLVERSDPTQAALHFIGSHSALLKIDDPNSLALSAERQGLAGRYLRFSQTYAGYPVFGGEVVVHAVPKGARTEIRSLNLALRPFNTKDTTSAAPACSLDAARALVVRAAQLDPRLSLSGEAVLGWNTDQQAPRLVCRVQLHTEDAAVDLEAFVGADGQVFGLRDRRSFATGTGQVFDPSPVGSTGNTNLTDNNDTTSATLDAARFSVPLVRLDGSGFLRGDFADARPTNAGQRATSAGLSFNFDRADNRFEEVMAYFHITRAQERIQALGFTNINNRRHVAVVNDGNQDNSFYSPGTKQVSFGAGGVDDAEDADIIVHEYGHSIQDNQVPGFGGGDEGSMGEGFGDYLAGSFLEVLSPSISDPACVGDWDATSYDNRNPPCLRRLDESKHFPEFTQGEVHADGEMWSAALFRARNELGSDVMDTLVLESHFALSTNESFFSAADAIIAADEALFAGQHVEALLRSFIEQGISREITSPANFPVLLQTVNVSIDNPRTGNTYANFLDNSQVITQPGAASVRVHFAQLDTELDPGCLAGACDNVYLYDGEGRLYQILNGNLGPTNSVQIPGDTVRVRLVTDVSVGRFGYHIDRVEVFGNPGVACGNGVAEVGESCDGGDLSGQSCVALGFDGGVLSCDVACAFDLSACTVNTCGDGILDAGEDCDGQNLGGDSCISLGFDGGALSCAGNCLFDASACVQNQPQCGNGVVEAGEDCDGFDLGGESCSTQGFTGGTLACNATCTFDNSDCATCGDGVISGDEACDGADLGGADCDSLGLANGVLRCSSACTIDEGACLPAECRL